MVWALYLINADAQRRLLKKVNQEENHHKHMCSNVWRKTDYWRGSIIWLVLSFLYSQCSVPTGDRFQNPYGYQNPWMHKSHIKWPLNTLNTVSVQCPGVRTCRFRGPTVYPFHRRQKVPGFIKASTSNEDAAPSSLETEAPTQGTLPDLAQHTSSSGCCIF